MLLTNSRVNNLTKDHRHISRINKMQRTITLRCRFVISPRLMQTVHTGLRRLEAKSREFSIHNRAHERVTNNQTRAKRHNNTIINFINTNHPIRVSTQLGAHLHQDAKRANINRMFDLSPKITSITTTNKQLVPRQALQVRTRLKRVDGIKTTQHRLLRTTRFNSMTIE